MRVASLALRHNLKHREEILMLPGNYGFLVRVQLDMNIGRSSYSGELRKREGTATIFV